MSKETPHRECWSSKRAGAVKGDITCEMALYPTLMETLLAKKIEMASQQGGAGPGGSRLFRTDSLDSTSSIGSLSSMVLGEDVCRCDDCLLGIVDLYTISPVEQALSKKKVNCPFSYRL